MTSGIYKITFPSGKFYIGSSINIEQRIHSHVDSLEKGKHNILMQEEWEYYRDFEYCVLEECGTDNLIKIEQYYIDNLKPPLNIALRASRPSNNKARSVDLYDSKNLEYLKSYPSINQASFDLDTDAGTLRNYVENKMCFKSKYFIVYSGENPPSRLSGKSRSLNTEEYLFKIDPNSHSILGKYINFINLGVENTNDVYSACKKKWGYSQGYIWVICTLDEIDSYISENSPKRCIVRNRNNEIIAIYRNKKQVEYTYKINGTRLNKLISMGEVWNNLIFSME